MKTFLALFCYSICNFIAWNYVGMFYIINVILTLYFLTLIENKKTYIKIILIIIFLLLFNFTSIFWLIKVDGIEGILSITANSIFYLPLFLIYLLTIEKKKYNLFLFLVLWVVNEYLLTLWDLAFPWLTLGNTLGNQWYLINWYSIFGVYGGSFWILITGYILYKITLVKQKNKTNYLLLSILLLLPLQSFISYILPSSKSYEKEYIILCYNPTYKTPKYNTTKKMYKDLKNCSDIDYIIMPELFYTNLFPYELKKGELASYFQFYFNKNPKTRFIIGAELLNSNQIKFNGTAILSKNKILYRIKKKYVPFKEYTPTLFRTWYPNYYMKNKKDNQKQIIANNNLFPLVCYESIFSTFTAKNTHNTYFIPLLTSESFMNNSSFGKKQYLNIIRIRAIETQKPIVKISRNGISCVILNNGAISRNLNKEIDTIILKTTRKSSIYSQMLNL